MGKNKRRHLAELETFSNVYQFRKEFRGVWNKTVFKNGYPLTLELACGKGEYTLALARKFPRRNFIGVDIKGARIWRGALTALQEELSNVAFLRTYIDHLPDYFDTGEVEELWIIFPDPYERKSKSDRRLTSPAFLDRYKRILKPGAVIHLKTDNTLLYEFTLGILTECKAEILWMSSDLYSGPLPDDILAVKTFYELQHLAEGKKIKYIRFGLPH